MPSLKASESKEPSQKKPFSLLFPAPSALKASVPAPAHAGGWTATRSKATPPHVCGAVEGRGPHQRAVLALPAWKRFSDKRTGSSKRVRRQASAAKTWAGWGGGGVVVGGNTVTDRRARGQARIGVHSADLCKRQRHELFP